MSRPTQRGCGSRPYARPARRGARTPMGITSGMRRRQRAWLYVLPETLSATRSSQLLAKDRQLDGPLAERDGDERANITLASTSAARNRRDSAGCPRRRPAATASPLGGDRRHVGAGDCGQAYRPSGKQSTTIRRRIAASDATCDRRAQRPVDQLTRPMWWGVSLSAGAGAAAR